ncbi:thiol:disulfide interchange protein [Neptunitalea chrysea]|uniref:Thiol:disulfide interchange protein n=1 Tax=Neptunitalea chrysea TaxID=1647581 RepID=A0A9W6EUZ0_9FLAO|nr:TlpA disulfide reductase family protein [Neptunitalea chrysea]GLB51907.1 thiol:disulfide interchange protein [Neptunitalea chrysea]
MRKILFVISIALVTMVSCKNNNGSFHIEANAQGVSDGTFVYLKQKDTLNKIITLDTAVVSNGKFIMDMNPTYPQMGFILVDSVQGGLPIIVEKSGNLKIEFRKDSLYQSKFGGTPYNDDFFKIFTRSNAADDSIRNLSNTANILNQKHDTLGLQKLQEKLSSIRKNVNDFNIDFIKNNPNSFASAMIIDRRLVPGPSGNSEDQKMMIDMFNGLTDEVKSTPTGKKIQESIAEIKRTGVGSIAPNVNGITPTGETLSLNDVKQKVTMIDFWASWCQPCRKENPNLVKLYNAYKKDGFTIYSISTDRDEKAWKRAIDVDQLTFPLVRSEEAAKTYKIRFMPTSLLLDSKGAIIEKNKYGKDLEALIAENLGVENKNIISE